VNRGGVAHVVPITTPCELLSIPILNIKSYIGPRMSINSSLTPTVSIGLTLSKGILSMLIQSTHPTPPTILSPPVSFLKPNPNICMLKGLNVLLVLGNSYVYNPNPNSFDCPPDSYHPSRPTYETYSYDSYGNDSQFGYDCQPQFPLNYESEPGYIENYNSYPYDSSSLPQQYPCCTRYSYNSNSLGFDQPQPPQSPVIYQPPQELSIQEIEDLKQQHLDELKRLSNLEYRDEIKIVELKQNFNGMSIEILKKEKLLQQERWAYLSTHPSKHLTSCCYDDDEEEDYTSPITPDEPILSTEKPDNSLSMGDEHLDTISATESDEFIKSSVETLIPIPSKSEGIPEHVCDVSSHDNSLPLDVLKDQIEDFSDSNDEFSSTDDDSFSIDNIDYVEASPPDSELVSSEVMEIVILEVEGIDDDILLTIKDDILREKLLNVNLLNAKIKALNANPTPSSDCKTKSSSTSLNSLLEETNTFDNSLPEFETFCFDVEEISSGSTTTHPDISLSKYEAFYDDHVKEISSGSPTTHSGSSLYASFIFDLSINPHPPADRSDFYEFTDELIPFISPPEDVTKDVVEDISPTKEPQVHNALPTHPTLQLNLKFQPSSEYLFTYVVWIFLPFLLKEYQEKDKIKSKPDENGKRGEAWKTQKQSQSRKKEKTKKIQVKGPKMQIHTKLNAKKKRKGLKLKFNQRSSTWGYFATLSKL
nr:hypothetical protein [Tanacetum cinerariifolium]